MGRRAVVRRAMVLLGGAALLLGCVPRAQGFEDETPAWTAEVSDRTGTVASIQILGAAGPGAELASDAIRLRNLGPAAVEVAWLGGTCVRDARFSLARDRGDTIDLRYDIGAPCPAPAAGGYALEISFSRPVDASTINAVPDWGP